MHVKWDGDGDEDPKTKLGPHEWIKFENNGVFGTLRSNPFLENVGYIHGSVLQDIYDYKRGITFHYGPGLGFQSKNFNGELTETLQRVIPRQYSNVQEYVDGLTEMNHGQRSFNVDDYYNLLPEERIGYFAIEWEEMNNEWEEKLGVFDAAPNIMRSTISEGKKQTSFFFTRGISFDSLFEPEKMFSALAKSIGLTDDEYNTDEAKSFLKILEDKFEGIQLDDDDYTRIEL